MRPSSLDQRVRLTAFNWLDAQRASHGDVLPWSTLLAGFELEGRRVPLLSQQGIFKPRLCDLPLSIRTSTEGPYKDELGSDGTLRYAYRGPNPAHRDNLGLRGAMETSTPLIYFFGILPGRYLAVWPVLIVGDDPRTLFFNVEVDDPRVIVDRLTACAGDLATADPMGDASRRRYITATVRRRVHQEAFRERVLHAYQTHCALCHLRHQELLDAAHIIPDTEDRGDPVVPNGLALCKLHHTAFDRHFLTVRPDYVIRVRQDVLDEEDGPMLLHGLQGMHDQRIRLPRAKRDWPDPDRLAERWHRFLESRP
jgi:putative restriction endonuclease